MSSVAGRDVSRETSEKLEAYVALLTAETARQNLIAQSTVADLWNRHVLDSAQLVRYIGMGSVIDVGSGAGLPGIILAILRADPVTMVEPRRLRVDFLQSVIDHLALTHATVIHGKASAVATSFDTITARAVAPAGDLFGLAHHLSRLDTVWVLPKGRNAQKELDEARATWQGEFRLEPSLIDTEASILVATGVRRRAR